jgi:hypothetical protein
MPADPDAVEIAQRFARALDHEDYPTAARLISGDCVYRIGESVFRGPTEITESYRTNGDEAAALFESIEYASSVEPTANPGAALITFEDRIRHGERTLIHRCQQLVTLDADGRIHEIEHRDLPGERDALQAFLSAVGLAKT